MTAREQFQVVSYLCFPLLLLYLCSKVPAKKASLQLKVEERVSARADV